MRDLTFTELERLDTAVAADEAVFHMDEDAFRAFYDRTARSVWMYLARITGSPQAADDLLQEAYYRFLRTERTYADEGHRRNYLYRIATNLARDAHRRARLAPAPVPMPGDADPGALAHGSDVSEDALRRTDVHRALARLRPRDRSLLWLAYAQGATHHEIAATLGLKTSSIKLLLFRARRRMAALLGGSGR
jgi:RNA polymerase sigma-70 factor (ECF subfamily)